MKFFKKIKFICYFYFYYKYTVLQYTYELLGMLARDFPECMLEGNDIRIRDLYFNTLETKLLKIEDVSNFCFD